MEQLVTSPSQIQYLEDLLCYLITRDSWGMWVIEGPPRSGKSNGAMYWAEVTHAAGLFKQGMQATNIHMLDGHESHLKLITDLQSLRGWCEANKKERKLYILDEAAKSFPKRTPMAKDNIEMLKEIQTLGHMRLYIILITQDPDHLLEGGLLNPTYCQGRLIFLSSERKGSFRYVDYWRPRELNFSDTGYPRTSIPYDPHHVSVFQRDGGGGTDIIRPVYHERQLRYAHGAKAGDTWESREQKRTDTIKEALLCEALLSQNWKQIKSLLVSDSSSACQTPSDGGNAEEKLTK